MEWAARIACLAVWLSLSRVDGSAVLLALVLARSLHIDFPPRHPDSETRIRRLPLHSSLSSPRPPALPPPHRLVQAVSPCHARLATALRSALPARTHPCLLLPDIRTCLDLPTVRHIGKKTNKTSRVEEQVGRERNRLFSRRRRRRRLRLHACLPLLAPCTRVHGSWTRNNLYRLI